MQAEQIQALQLRLAEVEAARSRTNAQAATAVNIAKRFQRRVDSNDASQSNDVEVVCDGSAPMSGSGIDAVERALAADSVAAEAARAAIRQRAAGIEEKQRLHEEHMKRLDQENGNGTTIKRVSRTSASMKRRRDTPPSIRDQDTSRAATNAPSFDRCDPAVTPPSPELITENSLVSYDNHEAFAFLEGLDCIDVDEGRSRKRCRLSSDEEYPSYSGENTSGISSGSEDSELELATDMSADSSLDSPRRAGAEDGAFDFDEIYLGDHEILGLFD